MARGYATPPKLTGPGADYRIQAAGITSLIKCTLMLVHNLIPPHPGIEAELNRHFPPLSENNMHIPQGSLPFTQSTECGKRRILINNFNATVS